MKPARPCRTCGLPLLLTAPARRLDCHTCASPAIQSAKRRAARLDRALVTRTPPPHGICESGAFVSGRGIECGTTIASVEGSGDGQASTESARSVAPDFGSERLEVARLRASLGLGR